MDSQQFDRFTKQVVARSSRRRAMTTVAGGLLGAVLGTLRGVDDTAARRCRKAQEKCKETSQCCGRKKFKCGHSHGGGSVKLTCCGKKGAPCPGNALGCCIPLVCNANNKCAAP